FTDLEQKELIITGRIRQYLSLVGEHLSLENIQQAITKSCELCGIDLSEFCIVTNEADQRHEWYLGVQSSVNVQEIMQTIDVVLMKLNDDYASVRKYNTLKTPIAHQVDLQLFYKYMEEK